MKLHSTWSFPNVLSSERSPEPEGKRRPPANCTLPHRLFGRKRGSIHPHLYASSTSSKFSIVTTLLYVRLYVTRAVSRAGSGIFPVRISGVHIDLVRGALILRCGGDHWTPHVCVYNRGCLDVGLLVEAMHIQASAPLRLRFISASPPLR